MAGHTDMERTTITIKRRIALRAPELPPDAERELREVFTHKNPQHAKLRGMGYAAKGEPALIKMWRREGDLLTLPRGGMQKVREVLVKHGVPWKAVDKRSEGVEFTMPEHRVELYDYQRAALEAAAERQNCLVRAPTGSGKTTAAIGIAAHLNRYTLVIVYDSGLQKQWIERLQKELGLRKRDIGVIGGGKFELKGITVAMQQTLNKLSPEKWADVNAVFGVVICDEVQRFAASTFLNTIDKCAAKYRIGISADETRKDGKEFLIYDVFGTVAYEVSRDELVERNVVHEVGVVVQPTEFEAAWYRKARRMNVHARENAFTKLLEEMTHDEQRNGIIVQSVLDYLRDGHRVLVFSHRVAHCRHIDAQLSALGVRSGLLLGGAENADEFSESVRAIKAGEIAVGIGTYQAIGQGLDLPNVDRGIATTPIGGNRQFWGQVRGRMCRTADGKDDAEILYIWDRAVFGRQPLVNLSRWNQIAHMRSGATVADYLKRREDETDGNETTQSGELRDIFASGN